MSGYTITFNAERDVAEIDFRDRFVAETVIPIIHELRGLDDGVERKGIVWDLRQADLSGLTMAMLRDVFTVKNEVRPARPVRPLSIACVVSNPTDAHILKLWAEGLDDSRPYRRRWFFCTQEAHAWIQGQDPAAPYGAEDGVTGERSDDRSPVPPSSASLAG